MDTRLGQTGGNPIHSPTSERLTTALSGRGKGSPTWLQLVAAPLTPSVSADAIVARGIAHVPEGRDIFAEFSVLENLLVGGHILPRADVDERLEAAFALFPLLRQRQGQRAGTLSGGEQQMLATARALMFEAKLLAIDEPSLGLAPRIRQELFAAIARIHAEGVPVLLVEQEVAQVFRMASRNYVLSQGRILAQGSGASLMADETLRAGYLGL